MFALAELESVLALVRASVAPTPQYAWPLLRARAGLEVIVKHENHTPIGAFKVRGGLVYMDRLRRAQPYAAVLLAVLAVAGVFTRLLAPGYAVLAKVVLGA